MHSPQQLLTSLRQEGAPSLQEEEDPPSEHALRRYYNDGSPMDEDLIEEVSPRQVRGDALRSG
jgi:hypothetical protein